MAGCHKSIRGEFRRQEERRERLSLRLTSTLSLLFCPSCPLGCGDVPSTAAGRSLVPGSWRQGYPGCRPPQSTCAEPQEHSPHNSRRPPQATAQATCGPVTPYQHVMGERRPQLRPGSPRRAGPAAARTRRYFGADFVPARMLAIFHEEQVELLGVT